ncbi:hypothetical protein [Legionella jordanis]|uniref:Uncharacterized protein n=1 Tax=Legionella jordanis TaxID=456 RepID=A0A0W0VG53_9GAMM|nr:hypothetical protein Ljor_0242 [Legionella jordanis]RMX05422.1 hypothetical protein EAW55_01865 [Legionella jordanis]RMX19104.1 hypothetical protein EAS68_06615 [Legionella jordanis]VEH13121.1 Uncharacterised protein [Legionella jordanis]
MKKIAALALALYGSLAMAVNPQFLLDGVFFQISARQWVTTQTALLTVNVNATLSNADLVKARADIMAMLTKIAPGDWHLTQFERSQDSSGLEKLFVAAEARVPQASLTDIYQHAKDVSKPGVTYTIGGVDFKPSLEEIQQVKQQLREKLYQQVNDELTRINKIYGNQNYSLNSMVFFDGETAPVQPEAYKARAMNTMMAAVAAAPAPALTVSNELIMSAMVELASNRKESNNAVANP